MYSGGTDERMRPKNKPRKDRRASTPSDRRNRLNWEVEAEKAAVRLLATLYRKEAGCITIRLSELTLRRLAEGTRIPEVERISELRSSVLAQLDRYGVVNHRVIRRPEDRLRIIQKVLAESIDTDDVEMLTSMRQVTYRLSRRQMKVQAKACMEHDQRVQLQREERSRAKKSSATLSIVRAV
jgi:hypothetical protein